MGFWSKWFGSPEQEMDDPAEYLPVGVDAFHSWAKEVVALTPLPYNDSMEFALATIILELDKSQGRITKDTMATMLVKAAANQIAAFIFQDIKRKRIEADETAKKEAQEKKAVEIQEKIDAIIAETKSLEAHVEPNNTAPGDDGLQEP
jgi:hypothetical protein